MKAKKTSKKKVRAFVNKALSNSDNYLLAFDTLKAALDTVKRLGRAWDIELNDEDALDIISSQVVTSEVDAFIMRAREMKCETVLKALDEGEAGALRLAKRFKVELSKDDLKELLKMYKDTRSGGDPTSGDKRARIFS